MSSNTSVTSLPSSLPLIMIFDLTIYPSSTIRCLGFLLDSFLSFNLQILSVAFSCFHLRHIIQIFFYLDDNSLKLLVCSLFLTRLDYCNSLYFNLPKATLFLLTKTFNFAARLVSHNPKFSQYLHLLSIFTGYFFTFALLLKSLLLCTKFFILLRLPIFLTFYYLLNVPAYGLLLVLNSSLSLSLSLLC